MALTALAAYSDSDESGEEEAPHEIRSKNLAPLNAALQSKQEIRRLVPVVATKRGRTSSSVKIGLPVVEAGEVSCNVKSIHFPLFHRMIQMMRNMSLFQRDRRYGHYAYNYQLVTILYS